MRLRLESSPPLPHLKAWFSPSQFQSKPSTHSSQHGSRPQSILDLKKYICTTIKPLSEAGVGANDIILELDGFELLNDFFVDELVREGDLILVGAREGIAIVEECELVQATSTSEQRPEIGKKRKLNLNTSQFSRPERTRKRQKRVSSSSSESKSSLDSSSSQSESDSSSESLSSESDSDSESSGSDTSSASSHTSSPSEVPTKRQPSSQNLLNGKSQKKYVSLTHVPPGQGSAQTHKRNLRRRLKRQYSAAAARGEELLPLPKHPKGLSDANQAPLGSREFASASNVSQNEKDEETGTNLDEGQVYSSSTTPYLAPSRDAELNLSMFSLGNKNKKKGFKKQAWSFPKVTGKVVFSADSPQTPQLLDAPDSVTTHVNEELQDPALPYITEPVPQARPRLIPPSEKQALRLLPRNVWVSTVDVEEGLGKAKKKKTQKTQGVQGNKGSFAHSYYTHIPQDGYVSCQREEEQVIDTLSYGDNVEQSIPVLDEEQTEEEAKSKLLWSISEQSFDSLPTITAEDKEGVIHAGVIVGWKALALNPITYSPEILLHLAAVLATSTTSVSIRKIVRPGWEDYMEKDGQDEEVEWERVMSEGWRVVKPK